MGPAVFVIAILGCGEGDAACRPVEVAEVRYESREACLAATEATVERYSALDFPVVVAQCRPAASAAAPLRASEVRLPEPDRRPSAWDR